MKNLLTKAIPVFIFLLISSICFASDKEELFNASDTGNFPMAKQIIDTGVDVNSKNEGGLTALHIAATWNDVLKDNAMAGKFEIAKILIRKGANINGVDNDGYTPLHWAAEQQSLEFVKLLAENGAHIDVKDKYGSTPFHFVVATSWQGAVQVAEFLLENGARVDSRDNFGNTPLHKSTMGPNPEAIRLLLRKGADVNAANKNGQTPLHIAAQYGWIDPAKILIEYGADIKAKTAKRVTIKAWQVTFPAGSTAAEIAGTVRKQKFVDFLKKVKQAEFLFQKAYRKYKEKNDQRAVTAYEEALKYYESGKIYYHYGNSLSNLKGRLKDSINAYQNAIESDYYRPYLAYYNIACVCSRMENKEKAHEYLTIAVKHGYNTFQRLLKDPDLAYIRSKSDWESFYKKLNK